jgi:hypothetical protein
VVIAVIAVLLVVSWNVGRHGERRTPERHWRQTDEVFRDPSTDRLMRVWEDPVDGSRHYIPERDQRPGDGA